MSFTAPEDAFLDVNDAHLRVYGNVHADGLKLGQLEVVTTTSTGSTIQFLHQHTAFTTSSNIEVGTTNHDLFVDTSTSRVGILTNTPTTALDVNGTVKATAFDGDGALLTGIPSSAINGTLSQWTTVTGPKIHYSDGQVGIGIADPLWALDVVGDINFTGTLREDGNPFVSTPWTIESSPTALSYTGGNVGIGAATPTAKLEVTGNAHVSTDLSVGGNLTINTISAAATHSLAAVTALGASTGETLQLTHATTGLVATGSVTAGTFSGPLTGAVTGNATTATKLAASVDIGGVAFDGSGDIVPTTFEAATFSGDVGIGTTSPIGNLSVVRDTVVADSSTFQRGMFYKDGKLQITPPDLYSGYPLNGDFLTTTRYKTDGTTGFTGAAIGVDYTTTGSFGSSLYFKTASSASSLTEKVRITDTGNVGIGNINPLGKLDIFDTDAVRLRLTTSSTNARGSIDIIRGDGGRSPGDYTFGASNYYDWRIGSDDTTDYNFSIRSKNTSLDFTSFYIKGLDGNVGIGTTNPTVKLQVERGSTGDTISTGNAIFDVLNDQEPNYGKYGLFVGVKSGYGEAWLQSGRMGTMNLGGDTSDTFAILLNPNGGVIKVNGTSYSSDDRIKSNEQYIENATETLLKLKPQTYDKGSMNMDENNGWKMRESGLIAQDVWYDAPELRHLVSHDKDAEIPPEKPYVDDDPQKDPDYSMWGEIASLNYESLIAYLIKSNQELHARIQALENA